MTFIATAAVICVITLINIRLPLVFHNEDVSMMFEEGFCKNSHNCCYYHCDGYYYHFLDRVLTSGTQLSSTVRRLGG